MNKQNIFPIALVILATVTAAGSMVFMEWEIDPGINLSNQWAIASIALVRIVLFASSGAFFKRGNVLAGSMSIAFSIALSVSVYFYAENIAGISPNTLILYHVLNGSILAIEWIMSFWVNMGDDEFADIIQKAGERDKFFNGFDKLVKETDRHIETIKTLKDRLKTCEIKLKASDHELKHRIEKVIAYERIKPILNKPFMKGNTCYVIDEDTRELLSIGRGSSEVESKAGKIYTKPINGKAKTE